jgi:hypothetical protein
MKNFRLALGLLAILAAACGGTSDDESSKADLDDDEALGSTSQALSINEAIAASKKKGLVLVDPNTLNPPPISMNDGWVPDIPYDVCFKAGSGTICLFFTRTWQVGDGSLEGAGGRPLDPGMVCADGHSLYATFDQTWTGIRYYDANRNLAKKVVLEKWEGRVYNSRNASKWARLYVNDIVETIFTPQGELFNIYGNDFSAAKRTGQNLARSFGELKFAVDGSLTQTGQHPLNDYYFGDPSGLVPLCNYLK